MNENTMESAMNNQQPPPRRARLEGIDIVSLVITGAIWAAIGGLAGRLIGRFGDTVDSGIGTRVGTIIGAITAGTVAISTNLHRKDHDASTDYYAQLPSGRDLAPTLVVKDTEQEGTVAPLSKGIAKPA